MRKYFSTTNVTAVTVLILVVLIGFVTRLAWNTINDTTLEQARSSQLQLVTALSQQTQANLNSLEGSIDALSGREEIQATSATRTGPALALLEREPTEHPEGVIKSITRFDFRGNPRYAWPPDLNELIKDLSNPSRYRYQIPGDLLALTERGQRVTSEIAIELQEIVYADGNQSTLIISPVDSTNLNTEFIVYEIDMQAVFQDLFSFVDLGNTGQLWVLNRAGTLQYSARPEPTFDTVRKKYSIFQLGAVVISMSSSKI